MALVASFARDVLPEFTRAAGPPSRQANPLRPVVSETYAFSDIAAAHAAMERDQNFGKIVLAW
jgi:hypothetical protein